MAQDGGSAGHSLGFFDLLQKEGVSRAEINRARANDVSRMRQGIEALRAAYPNLSKEEAFLKIRDSMKELGWGKLFNERKMLKNLRLLP